MPDIADMSSKPEEPADEPKEKKKLINAALVTAAEKKGEGEQADGTVGVAISREKDEQGNGQIEYDPTDLAKEVAGPALPPIEIKNVEGSDEGADGDGDVGCVLAVLLGEVVERDCAVRHLGECQDVDGSPVCRQ